MPRFSSAPIQQYRGTHGALRTYVGPEGELVMDTTQGRVVVMDGETAGGIPLARLDEITGTTFVRTDGAVELDGTAGRSIRYYITVDGSATIPEGVSAPYWVWNYIVDDEETNFTLQFLRATDGSIYNREGSEPEGSGSDWSEWARIGGGSADEFVTLDTEQTITGKKTFYATEIALESDVEMQDNIIRFTRTDTGREIRVGVGEGGQNRGIYDADNNCWMIYYNSRDELVLDGGATVGSASEPIYLNKGVPTACSIDTSNYVTLDTEQTITGAKTFDDTFSMKIPYTYDETPSSAKYPGIYFTDTNGTRIGKIEFAAGTDGSRYIQLCTTDPGFGGSSPQSYLRFGYEEDGSQTFKVGTMTVGSSSTPIYLNSGTPTACSVSDIAVQMVAATPNCYRRSELMTPNQTSITIHPTQVNINGAGYISTTDVTLQLSDVLSASNRAGTDMYVYACEPSSGTVPTFVLSANSTVPSGYTADTSRKIGGFHCLCAAVGTISGHTLSGYAQGDILPASVWDLRHKPNGDTEGRVYWAPTRSWHTIYGLSYDGTKLRSLYGGSVVTGTTSVPMHGEKFSEELAKIDNRLMTRDEFASGIAKGTPEGLSAVEGGSNPGTTGGHVNQNGQRIISNIGCEDCIGCWWWWTGDVECVWNSEGTSTTYQYGGVATNVDNWYLNGYEWEIATSCKSGHPDIDGSRDAYGRSYGGTKRLLAGAYWNNNGYCGSRSVVGHHLSANVYSNFGGRGAAESAGVEDL